MKVLKLKWCREGDDTYELEGGRFVTLASITRWRGGFEWMSKADEEGGTCDTLAKAKAAAEASLGAVAMPTAAPAIPPAPAIPLRWVRVDDTEYLLALGKRRIDLVLNIRGDWRVPSTRPDLEDVVFQDAAKAMRAVEATYGITEPLPIEKEVA